MGTFFGFFSSPHHVTMGCIGGGLGVSLNCFMQLGVRYSFPSLGTVLSGLSPDEVGGVEQDILGSFTITMLLGLLVGLFSVSVEMINSVLGIFTKMSSVSVNMIMPL